MLQIAWTRRTVARHAVSLLATGLLLSSCAGAKGGEVTTDEVALIDGSLALRRNLCLDPNGNEAKEEVCSDTNDARKAKGLTDLVLDASLSQVAQRHAEDMARRGYFSHRSPEGGTMSSRLRRAKIAYGAAGENIAKGYKSADSAVRGWLNSKGHRANMMSRNFRKVGVGYYQGHWVQVFTD